MGGVRVGRGVVAENDQDEGDRDDQGGRDPDGDNIVLVHYDPVDVAYAEDVDPSPALDLGLVADRAVTGYSVGSYH